MRFPDVMLGALEVVTGLLTMVGIAVSLPVLKDPFYDRAAAWHLIGLALAATCLSALLIRRASLRLRAQP